MGLFVRSSSPNPVSSIKQLRAGMADQLKREGLSSNNRVAIKMFTCWAGGFLSNDWSFGQTQPDVCSNRRTRVLPPIWPVPLGKTESAL